MEAQLRAELAKLMVLGQQTAVRMEATRVSQQSVFSLLFASPMQEVCTAVQEARECQGGASRMKGTAGTAHRSAGDGWLRSFKRERLHQGRCLSCSGLPCQLTSAGAPGGRRAAAVRFVEFLAVVTCVFRA